MSDQELVNELGRRIAQENDPYITAEKQILGAQSSSVSVLPASTETDTEAGQTNADTDGILTHQNEVVKKIPSTGNMPSYPMTAKAALQELMDRYRDGKLTDEPFIAEQMKIVNANR